MITNNPKVFYSLFAMLFFFSCFSQFNPYYSNSQINGGFVFFENKMFVNLNSKLIQLDINNIGLTPIDVITNLDHPTNLKKNSDTIFFSEHYSTNVYRFNAVGTPSPQILVNSNLINPAGTLLFNNELYICEFNGDKISKISMNGPFPTSATTIISGLNGPNDILKVGDYVYVTVSQANKIVRFNINNPSASLEDVFTSELVWPHSMTLVGEEIYVTSMNSDSVLKFNPNSPSPTLVLAYTLTKPTTIQYYDNNLYVLLRDSKEIVRTSLLLENEEFQNEQNYNIILYPNPTSSVINLSNLDSNSYEGIISNSIGQKISTVSVSNNSPIAVDYLVPGIYFIKIVGLNKTFQFIKL